jgi:3-methyladenine DNA glycosylase AlkD
MTTVSNWIENLKEAYIREADSERALAMAAYMKHNFNFIGLPAPKRKSIQKQHFEENKDLLTTHWRQVVKLLWEQESREFQYTALDLLLKFKQKLEINDIQLLEDLIRTKSWWDSVDFLAGTMVGLYFKKYSNQRNFYIQNWDASQYMWLQRTVLIFQLRYKDKTDVDLLFNYCRKYADSKEFFIRKAIGWSLRELAKTQHEIVALFVSETNLSGLSKREALKHLYKKQIDKRVN